MDRLVGDLLEGRSVGQGVAARHRVPVSLREIVERAVDDVTNGRPGVSIDGEARLVVEADPVPIEQIVTNLVANALDHGAPPVVVSLHGRARRVEIEVRDHGPGIELTRVGELFQRFSGLSSRSNGSHGLGLSITRDLARQLGGDVTYERADPGARFLLTLPRR